MKKLLMGLLAVGLVIAMAVPASAFDSEFGGYWRTRAYMQSDFAGNDSGAQDLKQVDTRTRLYYTAVFSPDFKFVNKFEFNNTWGDTVGGDIGTDGMGIFRIKNSYANFNLGSVNFLIGLQGRTFHRGFMFDDDFAGAVVTFNGPGFSIPFTWVKAYEGGMGKDQNDYDVDYYVVNPTFSFAGGSVTPSLAYMYSKDASNWASMKIEGTKIFESKIYIVGLDADLKFGAGSFWFTGMYEGGDVAVTAAGESVDLKAYLLALGGSFNAGPMDIHGQVFYATGDDNTSDNYEAFYIPRGRSYYWAEIMGYGIFDNQVSANSCADQISNIMAANIGVGFKVSDKVKLTADLWYAKLAENNAAGDDVLGTEIDLKLTYSLMKNLNLDLIGAYLFAGDATYKGANDSNPYEIGTRLSFSF